MTSIVMGIETSCDETAVAFITDKKEVLSHELVSQAEHIDYGGVIPELASRLHTETIGVIANKALQKANININDIDAVAVTAGPGLVGSLAVGLTFGKAVAYSSGKSFIAVNHVEAHALAIRSERDLDFPFISLIISGGHCEFVISYDVGIHEYIGGTIDDSLGEAFDKVAVMLGLKYPGGPEIEKQAKLGNPNAFKLPKPLIHKKCCDFSFSGLKTAVKNIVATYDKIEQSTKNDISASFQKCIASILCNRIYNVFDLDKVRNITNRMVVCGGVSKNEFLRNVLFDFAQNNQIEIFFPSYHLCTDNGIMIAWSGVEYITRGYQDEFIFPPMPKWELKDSLWNKINIDG